ncbi:hypothetical protein [Streptomyces sp. CRN 30]|uniref:hypothetical protein n=1 Tax=Streptomyces sp. CRN 30 TaxID=3075613 RepID=UPI002A838E73|nr:hypothetical protein [Streptomyces sp. CRN 30]
MRAVLVEGPPVRILLRHVRGALLLALGRRAGCAAESPGLVPVTRECLRRAIVPAPAPGATAPSWTVGGHDAVRHGASRSG